MHANRRKRLQVHDENIVRREDEKAAHKLRREQLKAIDRDAAKEATVSVVSTQATRTCRVSNRTM